MFLGLAAVAAVIFAALSVLAITANIKAQKRLEAIQMSLQAMLANYINYLDNIGFPANAVSIQIVEDKPMNAWYDG